MTNTICESLLAWGEGRPLPAINTTEPVFSSAIVKQDTMGWESMIDGFMTCERAVMQSDFMKQNNIQKSPLLWMAKVQNRVWMIAWKMWEQRNETLHSTGNLGQEHEHRSLNQAITRLWTRQNIPEEELTRNLFRGSMEQKLKDSINNKRLWLSSVWSLQKHLSDNEVRGNHRGGETLAFFEKWKARI